MLEKLWEGLNIFFFYYQSHQTKMSIRKDINIERNMLSVCSVGNCIAAIPLMVTDLLQSYRKPSVSASLSSFDAV